MRAPNSLYFSTTRVFYYHSQLLSTKGMHVKSCKNNKQNINFHGVRRVQHYVYDHQK